VVGCPDSGCLSLGFGHIDGCTQFIHLSLRYAVAVAQLLGSAQLTLSIGQSCLSYRQISLSLTIIQLHQKLPLFHLLTGGEINRYNPPGNLTGHHNFIARAQGANRFNSIPDCLYFWLDHVYGLRTFFPPLLLLNGGKLMPGKSRQCRHNHDQQSC
jgi:hypothetical protein